MNLDPVWRAIQDIACQRMAPIILITIATSDIAKILSFYISNYKIPLTFNVEVCKLSWCGVYGNKSPVDLYGPDMLLMAVYLKNRRHSVA
jgi:hypothetical protein